MSESGHSSRPRTTVTEVTVVLVAADGEWTRGAAQVAGGRRASAPVTGSGIPVYDVQKVGYPQRMRDYDARRPDQNVSVPCTRSSATVRVEGNRYLR